VPTLLAAGVSCLALSYRNAPGAPSSPDGRSHLGATEWEDVAAAVVAARRLGARRLVLFGVSMGGACIGELLRRHDDVDDVVAVVLDAPVRHWGPVLRAAARSVIVSRCVRGIDSRGLHNTNLEALRSALLGVARDGTVCLVDGFSVPAFGFEQRAVIDGDCRSAAIAAASVLAKVSRDRYMRKVAARHPEWDFDTNVGYSTPEHRAAIERQGVSPLHRMSFQSMAYQQLAL
jgi:ribonuclease HII